MSRNLIIHTLVLLALSAHARCQFNDFFQSFSTFIQPFTTTRRPELITKRPHNRQTTKQRYQDAIFFETDDFLKQRANGRTIDPFTTTSKPRRKIKTTRKPTTTKTTRSWYQASIKASNERTTNYNEANYDANQITNNRRVDNANSNINYNNDARNYNTQTTERQIHFAVAQKPIHARPNKHTTINPLLHRPGVRPAVVDDNRPPITNKPITNMPAYNWPATAKPDATASHGSEPNINIGPDEDAMTEAEKRKFIEIAEQKCDEYKTMNTKKVVALPLGSHHTGQGVEVDVPTCTPINIPLIIGGKVVSIQEFPHMSLVGWKNIQKGGYSWKCGGSLISDQFILTAGHCTYYDKDYNVVSGPPSAVQLGSSYIDGRDSLIVSISSLVRHPKYKVRRSYYDVALIKMITKISFTETIRPACLGVPPPVGDRIIATGWGRTEFGGDSSLELRSVSVPIWEMGECREVWGSSRKLPEGPSPASQLCAGERGGGKDTCQGDSGGPAQVQDGCSWRVVAVTSIGRSCGAAETPALYARLPRAFIASQVFSNVKLNTRNNTVNDKYNNDFNQAVSNQNIDIRDDNKRPGNHQPIGNWGVTNNYNQGNNQNFGNPDVRPGYETTASNRVVINNQFGNQNNGYDVYRPGNHQTVDNNNRNDANYFGSNPNSNNRDGNIRPGNHQTVNNRGNEAVNNYFVTSHTTGNNQDVPRLGNHQTVNTNNRNTNTGNNYFVTSHTTGNNRAAITRPGNHQTTRNNNNDKVNNRFNDNLNSENNPAAIYDVRSDRNDNDNAHNYNSNISGDNIRNTNTWASNNGQSGYNNGQSGYNNGQSGYNNGQNDYNNGQNGYYNGHIARNSQSSKHTTYSNFGSQNSDYGVTESVLYNGNNGYNVNNNRGFIVTNRPWWNR